MARAKRMQSNAAFAAPPATLRALADIVRAARGIYDTKPLNPDERLKFLRLFWRIESERPWVLDEAERLAGLGKTESRLRTLGFLIDCLPEEEKPKALGESVLEEMMRLSNG